MEKWADKSKYFYYIELLSGFSVLACSDSASVAYVLEAKSFMAEDEGFEPSVGCPTHAFQACALGRYANPPVNTFLPAKSIGATYYDLP